MKKLMVILGSCLLMFHIACATQHEVDRMEAKVDRLSRDYEESLSKLNNGLQDLEKQKLEWRNFERSYTPEVRQELYTNLEEAKRVLGELQSIAKVCNSLLAEVQRDHGETKRLKDKVSEYERESKKDNVMQQLRNERQEMLQKSSEAQLSAQTAQNYIKEIKESVQESKLAAETAAQESRDAAKDAKRAMQNSKKLDELAQDLEMLQSQLADLQKKVRNLSKKEAAETSTENIDSKPMEIPEDKN